MNEPKIPIEVTHRVRVAQKGHDLHEREGVVLELLPAKHAIVSCDPIGDEKDPTAYNIPQAWLEIVPEKPAKGKKKADEPPAS